MNNRLLGVLAFALVVSGGASFIIYKLVSARLASEQRPAQAQVLAAARNLEVGTLIKEADMKTIEWTGKAPPNSIPDPKDIVGRGVLSAIYENEPILESRLAPKGAGAGLAATIPVGMRAVAIRVNEVVGVAGFVVPGMRVDILILGAPPNAGANIGTASKTLLQNIEVLSAGQQIQKDAEGKPIPVPVVNLLVTPEQAEILSLASNDARIQLILRNPLDREESKTKGTVMSKLWTGQGSLSVGPDTKPPVMRPALARTTVVAPPPPAAKPQPPPPIVVEVIHGTAKAQAQFKNQSEEKTQ